MGPERRPALAALLIVAAAAVLSWGAMLGRASSDDLFYACVVTQAGLCLPAARLATGRASNTVMPVLLGGAILLRLWFLFTMPSLSGDIYRYIWDGRIVNAGFNPYLHVPADPVLQALRDPAQYRLIDKRDYAVTIYPPVAEALFALVTRVSDSVFAMKLAMTLLEGVAVLCVMRLLDRLKRPRGLLTLYLLHPAPIWEIAGNGHVDAAMMAFSYGAFAWAGSRLGAARPALVLALGTLVKPLAALGLPALWRPFQVLVPLGVLATVLACYLPFASAGTGVLGFLPNYAHEQGLDSGEGLLALAVLKRIGLLRPWMQTAYLLVAVVLLLGLALWTRLKGRTDLPARLQGTALLIMTALLLLTPVFPWYFLIAAPFTPLLGLLSPFVLGTGGFLLYGFNPDGSGFFGRWSLVMGLTVVAGLWDIRATRRRPSLSVARDIALANPRSGPASWGGR